MNLLIKPKYLKVDCKVSMYYLDAGRLAVVAKFCIKACETFTFPIQDGDFFQEKEYKSVAGSKSV